MLRRCHQILGIALAAYVITVSASGILLLGSNEYLALTHPDTGAFDPNAIAALTEVTDPAEVIVFNTDGRPTLHVYAKSGSQFLADPATGEVLSRWHRTTSLPAFLFELHVFLLAGELGHELTGILGISLTVTLTVGLILFRRRRKQPVLRRLWPASLSRTSLTRAHASQGALLAPLTIFLAISGVSMIYSAPVQGALNSLLGSSESVRPTEIVVQPSAQSLSWRDLSHIATTALPGAVPRMVFPPSSPTAPVVWRLRGEREWHPNGRSYVVINPGTGELLQVIDESQTGLGPRFYNILYPLHSATTSWPGHRLVVLLVGLSLIFMSIAGLRITWLRRTPSSGKKTPHSGSEG